MKFLTWCSLALFVVYVRALIPAKDVKPNVFVLTDISNEPDDAESLVRLLLYTNEISLKGIVATTSYWLNYTIHDEDIYPILDAYEKVVSTLRQHSLDYPTADYVRSIISTGYKAYGLDAFEIGKPSDGAKALAAAIENTPDGEVLDVLVWGGAGVLAETLKYGSKKLLDVVGDKIRVYTISDQDDAGPWIRSNFPQIHYVSSVHGFNQYRLATWVGISGDKYNHFDEGGPNTSLVTREWLREHVQKVGPLGAAYPDPMFIMEGDTPSTLSILPNGLNDPANPNFGGWGGRYLPVDISGRSKHYADAIDNVVGEDGRVHVSNQATIWRWRQDFQYDFAARMQWTVKGFDETVHQPIVNVNGSVSMKALELPVEVDELITLDASESYDLNDRKLSYKWFHYREITLTQGRLSEVKEIEITKLNKSGSKVQFKAPGFKDACHNLFGRPLTNGCKDYHIVLQVTNDGDPALSTYRRIILKTSAASNEFEEIKYEQLFFNAHNNHDHDEL